MLFRSAHIHAPAVLPKIHRHAKKKEMKYVALSSISPLHCIDRESAIKKVRERAAIIAEYRDELKKIRRLNKDTLLKYLPSVSGIKVIRESDDCYISFEGNGRVEAFKQVFHNDEIFNYRLRNTYWTIMTRY